MNNYLFYTTLLCFIFTGFSCDNNNLQKNTSSNTGLIEKQSCQEFAKADCPSERCELFNSFCKETKGNDNSKENTDKYYSQFSDYFKSFNNPISPKKWALIKDDIEQNSEDGRYDLPKNISDYIANNFEDIKKGLNFEKLFPSAAHKKIGILSANANVLNLDKAVIKLGGNVSNRIKATFEAHKTVKDKKLEMLYVPKFATGEVNGEKYILEELLDVDARHEFQENLYTALFTQAKNDENTKNKLIKIFEQITTFACLNEFSDIKYDNLPLGKEGKIILLDVEKTEGPIHIQRYFITQHLLNNEVSEFYIPSEYIDTIVRTARDVGNNFCNNIANKSNDDIDKAKENGDNRYIFLKSFADFKIKRGIISGKETFTNNDIRKAQDALTNNLDKNFIEIFLTMLNNSKEHDSRVLAFRSLELSMLNKLFKEKGFDYTYFKGNDLENPAQFAPFRVPLKKLKEIGLIYGFEFSSSNKNIDNILSKDDIKNIYF